MKNSKITKIFAIMAALIVLVCALGIAASAEGEELSVKINARNVSYGDLVKVLFAVDKILGLFGITSSIVIHSLYAKTNMSSYKRTLSFA